MKGALRALKKAPLPPIMRIPFSGVCQGEKVNPSNKLKRKKSVSDVDEGIKARDWASKLGRGRKRLQDGAGKGGVGPDVTVATPGDRYLRTPYAPNFRGHPRRGRPHRASVFHVSKPPPLTHPPHGAQVPAPGTTRGPSELNLRS